MLSYTKKQLRNELIKAYTRIELLEGDLENDKKKHDEIFEAYLNLVERGETRFDNVLDTLKPKEAKPRTSGDDLKPIRKTRESWARAAARQEARYKEDYWAKKSEKLEQDVTELEKKIDERNRG